MAIVVNSLGNVITKRANRLSVWDIYMCTSILPLYTEVTRYFLTFV